MIGFQEKQRVIRDWRIQAVGQFDSRGVPIVFERTRRGLEAMFHLGGNAQLVDCLAMVENGGSFTYQSVNMAGNNQEYKVWREVTRDAGEDGVDA